MNAIVKQMVASVNYLWEHGSWPEAGRELHADAHRRRALG
jgi:hypothetical protein